MAGFDGAATAEGSGQLQSVYARKCSSLGLKATPEIVKRLARLDAARGSELSLKDVRCDDTFSCVMDVVAVAAGITTVDLSSSSMTDGHVDGLVHHLNRSIAVRELKLNNNAGITDEGGTLLLDLLHNDSNLVKISLDGCSVSRSIADDIAEACKANRSPMPSRSSSRAHLSTPGDGEQDEMSYLNTTRRFNTMSFARQPGEMLLPPSPTFNADARRQAGQDGTVVAPRALRTAMDAEQLSQQRELCLAVTTMLRRFLAVFMWHSSLHSLVAAGMCFAVTGVPYFEVPAYYNALLVGSLWLQQQRIKRPTSEVALSSVTRCEEVWQRRVSLLRWVVLNERRLVSDDSPEEVSAAVAEVVSSVHKLYVWSTGAARPFLAGALFLLFLLSLCDLLTHFMFACVAGFFGYTPYRILRRQGATLLSTTLNPWAALTSPTTAGVVSGTADEFRGYEFRVVLKRLVGVSVRHFSDAGFVPFVQAKYNRSMWLFPKVQDPYVWDAPSRVTFRAVPGGHKLLLTVYDDSAEVVGPALHGFVIIDECTPLDEDIVVPLQPAKKEHTLVHELIDDVQRHDTATRSRFGGVAATVNATTGKGSLIVENPGSLVLVITPSTFAGVVGNERSGAAASRFGPGGDSNETSVRIAVEPASPHATTQPSEARSPQLTGLTPRQPAGELPPLPPMRTDSQVGRGASNRSRPESLIMENSGAFGAETASLGSSQASSRPSGPVVFRSNGSISA